MKKWAIVLIVLAALDIVTTYFSLAAGSIEPNPLFGHMSFGAMALIKMVAYSSVAYLLFRLKLKDILILVAGANAGAVISNLMAIWTLKTM